MGVGIAAASLGVGLVLGMAGHRFGPVAVLALPMGIVGVLATQGDPARTLWLVLLSVPVGFVTLPVLGFQLLEVAALVAAGLTVLNRLVAGRTPLVWPRLGWWPLAILLLSLVSALAATDLQLASKQVALLAGGLVLLLTTVTVLPDLTAIRRVLVLFALVGAGLGLHGLAGAGQFEAQAGALSVANRPTGIFASPNQLGAAAGMTVLIGSGLVLGRTRTSEWVAGTLGIVGGGAGLLVTLSRGAWFATGAAMVLFLVLEPRARHRSLRVVLPLALVAMVAGGALLPESSPQVQVVRDRFGSLVRVETSPYDERGAIWHEALRQAVDAPVLGQGPGNFPVVARRSVSEAVFVEPDHAHNTVLNVAAEFGVPALVLVVGFTVALLGAAVRVARARRSSRDRAVLAGLAGALAVQVAHGLVDYTLRNAVLALLTWLVAGMIVAADEAHRP